MFLILLAILVVVLMCSFGEDDNCKKCCKKCKECNEDLHINANTIIQDQDGEKPNRSYNNREYGVAVLITGVVLLILSFLGFFGVAFSSDNGLSKMLSMFGADLSEIQALENFYYFLCCVAVVLGLVLIIIGALLFKKGKKDLIV